MHQHTSVFQSNLGYATAPSAPWHTSRRVFRLDGVIDPNGGSDWFETAVVRPDKVLRDFDLALYPGMQVRLWGVLFFSSYGLHVYGCMATVQSTFKQRVARVPRVACCIEIIRTVACLAAFRSIHCFHARNVKPRGFATSHAERSPRLWTTTTAMCKYAAYPPRPSAPTSSRVLTARCSSDASGRAVRMQPVPNTSRSQEMCAFCEC